MEMIELASSLIPCLSRLFSFRYRIMTFFLALEEERIEY